MKRVLKYLLPYWWQIILTAAITYVTVWCTLQLPTMMSSIVNNGIINNDQSYIIREGLHMLGVAAIAMVAASTTGFLASRIATSFAYQLRSKTFRQIESYSLREMNQFSTASLITRTTNDIQQIQMVTMLVLRLAIQSPLMAIGAIFSALNTAPSMAWIMGLSVICLLILVCTIFFTVVPKFKVQQKLVDQLNLVARENLTGLRVIRAFNNEDIEEKKFDRANRDITKLSLWINRVINAMQPAMMLIINFTLLAIVWVGAHYVVDDKLEIGNMMAFMQYALQVITSFLLLIMVMVMLPRAQVSANRVGEVLSTTTDITDPDNPAHLDADKKGLLEFRNVTFSYPGADAPVLSSIEFTARPGQITAFVGSTGSGKSTLVNLIPRLYDVSSGQIMLDGHDLRKLARKDIIRAIGFVPQRGVLFSGTVESNIKYGAPNISDEQMERAAQIAQADFIKDLDGGFKAHIAQGGTNVSGGQRQRLSIARAIAKDPEVLVFDDSFSALDYKTDAALRQALATQEKDKTILIVAQRISTIRHADQIIVLDNGKMVGKGTHHQLLRNCKVYQEIAKSQFSEAELAKEMKEAADEQ